METDAAHHAELTLAPSILAALPLAGRGVTGDALYCQRGLCEQILAAHGHYLVVVKGNQPTLLDDLALLFDQPPPDETFATVCSRTRHGSRHEQRTLWASPALNGYLDWPGVQQVIRVERICTEHGQTTRQVRHFITSLPPTVSARRLLQLVRGHWAIENRLH